MVEPLWQVLESFEIDRVVRALDAWRAHDAAAAPSKGVLALVCEREGAQAVEALQRAARTLGLPLAGAIVPGVVADGTFRRDGALLLPFDASRPRSIIAFAQVDGRSSDEALAALAKFALEHSAEDGGDTLLLLVDAMTPDVASVLDRLYLDLGDRVNYAGACVGSETFRSMPCVFDEHEFVAGAVLAILLPRHPGIDLAHHYQGHQALWVATASTGSHVQAIDGRPAFDVYRQLMRSEYGIELDRDNFYEYAVHFPLALDRARGEPLVRIPVGTDDDGSVVCSGEVPENALVSVVRAIEPGSLETSREVAGRVRANGAQVALAFYCAGRLLHLGAQAGGDELRALADALAPAPVLGALCLGEIGAGSRQYPAFHNATIAAMPWN